MCVSASLEYLLFGTKITVLKTYARENKFISCYFLLEIFQFG